MILTPKPPNNKNFHPHKHTSTSLPYVNPTFPAFSPLGSASLGSRSSGSVHLTGALCSRLQLEIVSCLEILGAFRGGVLLRPSRGPGFPDPQVATVTSGLLWPLLLWRTCPSLVERGRSLHRPAAAPPVPWEVGRQ